MILKEKSGRKWQREIQEKLKRREWGGFDQNILYACMKLSSNSQK